MRVLSPRIEPLERDEDGIDRQHRHLAAGSRQMAAQSFDQGGFSHARHPGQADPPGVSGAVHHRGDQVARARLMVGASGFHQGDGARQGGAVAGDEALGEISRDGRGHDGQISALRPRWQASGLRQGCAAVHAAGDRDSVIGPVRARLA
jgi:hypothetical protein